LDRLNNLITTGHLGASDVGSTRLRDAQVEGEFQLRLFVFDDEGGGNLVPVSIEDAQGHIRVGTGRAILSG
jgi:hypothetical protein